MITKCKKCGCDTLIKNGEWYECPMCGTMMFDTSIFVGKIESPTKTLEMIDEGKVTATAQISKPFSIDAEENHEEKTFESTIEIIKAAGVSAGKVTLGIPGMARAKQIITDYYMGK